MLDTEFDCVIMNIILIGDSQGARSATKDAFELMTSINYRR